MRTTPRRSSLIGLCFFTAHCTERDAGEGELLFGCAHHGTSLAEGGWNVNSDWFQWAIRKGKAANFAFQKLVLEDAIPKLRSVE
jgi:hypothetical protein